MQVRKYEASTIKEAVDMVKSDLGPDAIILSTRESIKSLGAKAGKRVMVTAAVSGENYQMKKLVEENLTLKEREKLMTRPVREQREFINHVFTNLKGNIDERRRKIQSRNYASISDEDFIEDEEQEVEDFVPVKVQPRIPKRSAATTSAAVRKVKVPTPEQAAAAAAHAEYNASVAKRRVQEAAEQAFRASAETMPEKPKAPVAMTPRVDTVRIDELKNEIKRLQQMIKTGDALFKHQNPVHPGSRLGVSADMSLMFEKLSGEGFEERMVAELLKNAENQLGENSKKRSLVEAYVAKWIYNGTEIVKDPFFGRYHFFVGPRGVGKTSTLVKMASHLVLKEKKRIAIITTDTNKVGATEQLRIYSQILNVPFAVWQAGQDLNVYLKQIENVDVVLFDTEGRSLQSMEEIDSLKQLIPASLGNVRVHLVLSAMLKDEELYSAARRFRSMNYNDVIFTNVDQLRRHGMLVNFQKNVRTPYFAFSMGPMIPEDFEWASKERVLDLIFKISKSKSEGEKND
jgi:flagellar biosynthesis protein FlhF